MKTRTIKEEPAITLRGDCAYNDEGQDVPLYVSKLKSMRVGDKVCANRGGTPRASIEECLEVVYKNEQGLAGLVRTIEYTDAPKPEKFESVELIWFEFGQS